MKKIYEKNELTFALVCIAVYCVVQSLANPLNDLLGVEYSASALFCVIEAVLIILFISKNGLAEKYGLCKPHCPATVFLFYIPLAVLASANLWSGVTAAYSPAGIVCHTVCMLCVGFLEEIIFRGFLFLAMAKTNPKAAVIVSSVTFGIGHIINLINGSGMDFIGNLIQVVLAVAIGFLFVTIFCRGGSLIPCIATHCVINIMAGYAAVDTALEIRMIRCVIMTALTVGYTVFLTKTSPKTEKI